MHRLAPLAERAGVALQAEDADRVPGVLADRERIEQVLVAVIHNAIKFTPPGGAIDVRTAALPDRVQIAVADTGVGVEPRAS